MLPKENFFVVGEERLRPGEIPSMTVYGRTLPEAWENSVLAVWQHGAFIPTEYDQPIDPESRDATAMIIVSSPLEEPRIHKALPCSYEDLGVYTQEIIAGVHDHWVGKDKGWSYSYHDRLTNWPGINSWGNLEHLAGQKVDLPFIDQINTLMTKLSQAPHSRRAQAITWFPFADALHDEPPCLQRIWCRVVKSGEVYLLEMNTHWRSRDAFKAAFMNMFAITELQKGMAKLISRLSGREVKVGRYIDISDSLHIYGSYIRRQEMDGFFKSIEKRDFGERVIRSDDRRVQSEFKRALEKLTAESL